MAGPPRIERSGDELTVVIYERAKGDDYDTVAVVRPGETHPLVAPFAVVIDTAELAGEALR